MGIHGAYQMTCAGWLTCRGRTVVRCAGSTGSCRRRPPVAPGSWVLAAGVISAWVAAGIPDWHDCWPAAGPSAGRAGQGCLIRPAGLRRIGAQNLSMKAFVLLQGRRLRAADGRLPLSWLCPSLTWPTRSPSQCPFAGSGMPRLRVLAVPPERRGPCAATLAPTLAGILSTVAFARP